MQRSPARRSWHKDALTRGEFACLSCGPPPVVLPSRAILAVGCGTVTVTRDGAVLWAGDDEEMTAYRWTRRANADPEHDWRIEFAGPLHGETYQRQGNRWVMIDTNSGFV